MAWHLEHLLRGLCGYASAGKRTAVGDVCRVSPEDHQQLQAWNGEVPARVDRCVHELVAERCRAQPDAPAVCAWDGDLTYGELDALSSALAAHLAARGVGPEVFVPLCFEKSRWTTVAMVGVMKAGGAFVLLDPSHPAARRREICRAVSAGVVVASVSQAEAAAALAPQVVVVGDSETAWRDAGGSVNDSSSAVAPDNTLYAVFTSGSTGSPKGAVIHHTAFATSALAHGSRLHLIPQARVLQFVSYGFDVSISDSLTTLIFGACICVPSDPERSNNLALTIDEYGVNWAHLTPSLINVLEPQSVPGLQVLALIGEPMAQADVETWGPQVQLINSYGPAECAVVSTVQANLTSPSNASTIGQGTGCVCWVVDRANHERLVPIGAVGELLIEGPIVGRGYLNDPERTAAAFIDPPAWLRAFRHDKTAGDATSDPQTGRLYKTDDLVQYAADGSLRFIGRKDTQVKLRGQRIELGEVEHHTRRSFRGAGDVVAEVVTPAEAGRPPLLVAFVLAGGPDCPGDEQDIVGAPTDAFRAAIPAAEAALHDTVPAYMVPAVFLPIVAVPLVATGKTDRRRLRDRAAALSRAEVDAYRAAAVAKRAPATSAERTLQQLWANVLNISADHIGADDSFFRLGGDSIAAMKLAGVARDKSLSLTVADVFQHPNLADLASILSRPSLSLALPTAPEPFSLLDTPDHVSFVHELASRYSCSSDDIVDALPTTQLQSDFVHSQQCTYFFVDIPGVIDPNTLQNAIHTLADCHPILRAVFFPSPRGTVQAIVRRALPAMVRYTCTTDLLQFSTTLCHEDSMAPLPFGTMPFQVSLVSESSSHHVLVLRLSHAQYDGLCLPVLYHDLAAAYRGDTIPQPPGFSRYMQYRLSHTSADVFQFWREFLSGASMTQLDYGALGGIECTSSLKASLQPARNISLPSSPPGITVASLVKGALSFVLAQLTRQSDVLFGQTISGRSVPVPGVERILGPCVNAVPVRVNFQSEWTVLDLLQHIQDQHMRVLPFETSDLRDIVKRSTAWPDSTEFGIIFQHDNIEMNPPLMLADVKCTTSSVGFQVAKQFCVSSQLLDGSLKLCISAPRKMASSVFVAKILDDLCQTVLSFTQDPGRLLCIQN